MERETFYVFLQQFHFFLMRGITPIKVAVVYDKVRAVGDHSLAIVRPYSIILGLPLKPQRNQHICELMRSEQFCCWRFNICYVRTKFFCVMNYYNKCNKFTLSSSNENNSSKLNDSKTMIFFQSEVE